MKLYPESVWKLECGAYSVETRLPTTNCSALLKSGLIPDPYKGLNEKETLWIGEKDTVLETSFEVAEELLTKPAELVMTGVDTVFDEIENARRRFENAYRREKRIESYCCRAENICGRRM